MLTLADRRNPSPYQLFDPGMRAYLSRALPGGLSGFAAGVALEHPTLIAARPSGLPDWARPELGPQYRYAGRGPDWTWWIVRTAGRVAAAAVLAANRVARHTPA